MIHWAWCQEDRINVFRRGLADDSEHLWTHNVWPLNGHGFKIFWPAHECLGFSPSTPRLVSLPSHRVPPSSHPPPGPFPLSSLSPVLSFCLTTATASAGMSAAWRDTHIKMNSPIRHCFRCYRTTRFFVIKSSPSLPPKRHHVCRDCSHLSAGLLLISDCTHMVMALNNARL